MGVVPQADPAGGWRSYVAWPAAAPGEAPGRVVLLGSGGVLYPAGLLDPALLLDAGRARRVCPTADDLWFWAVAVRAGVPRICLDGRRPIPVKAQMRTPALRDRNHLPDGNDAQFAAVIAELELAPLLRGAAV